MISILYIVDVAITAHYGDPGKVKVYCYKESSAEISSLPCGNTE